jgi:hypothetical protein
MASTSVSPIFVNGPLKGQDYAVQRDLLHTGLRARETRTQGGAEQPDIKYFFHRFGLLGNVLWLGSVQPTWDAVPFEDLKAAFDQIASAAAKAAKDIQ